MGRVEDRARCQVRRLTQTVRCRDLHEQRDYARAALTARRIRVDFTGTCKDHMAAACVSDAGHVHRQKPKRTSQIGAKTLAPRLRQTYRTGLPAEWACSSVGEHLVDIEGVTSSILVTPTIPASSIIVRGSTRKRSCDRQNDYAQAKAQNGCVHPHNRDARCGCQDRHR